MLSVVALAGAELVRGVGSKVAGAAWSVAMRGRALLALAAGGEVNFAGDTGLTAGAAPLTGWVGCCAASFCLASGERA